MSTLWADPSTGLPSDSKGVCFVHRHDCVEFLLLWSMMMILLLCYHSPWNLLLTLWIKITTPLPLPHFLCRLCRLLSSSRLADAKSRNLGQTRIRRTTSQFQFPMHARLNKGGKPLSTKHFGGQASRLKIIFSAVEESAEVDDEMYLQLASTATPFLQHFTTPKRNSIMTEAEPSKQIRPNVRSKVATQPAENTKPKGGTPIRLNEYDTGVEETTQRMKKWMGLGEGSSNNNNNTDTTPPRSPNVILKDDDDTTSSIIPATIQKPSQDDCSSLVATGKPAAKSILKIPKYTKQSSSAPSNEPYHPLPNQVDDDSVRTKNPICKSVVVERDPTQPMRKRPIKPRPPSAQSHSAVEGYVPSTVSTILPPVISVASEASGTISFKQNDETPQGTSQQQNKEESASTEDSNDDTSPLVLTSLEELFEAAGHVLPPQQHDPNKITPDSMLVEADIAFSVMSQDQYDSKLSELKEQHEEERQAQLKIFLGSEKIFYDEASQEGGDYSSDDDDDDDDLLEVLMGGGEENADDYYDDGDGGENDMEVERQPRAFRLLWDTLSEWITPEAIHYLTCLKVTGADVESTSSNQQPKWTSPAIERSDVEASRCAGLMAMVKLYLPKCLEELGFHSEVRRTADVRLGELLRTFNYVQDAPKLPVKLWKAMTCILLNIVLAEHDIKEDDSNVETKTLALPPSIASVDMTTAEYHYLTCSVVKTFGLP